jgi:hypothetical protein
MEEECAVVYKNFVKKGDNLNLAVLPPISAGYVLDNSLVT